MCEKNTVASKVCASHCPNCGAGQDHVTWDLFTFDECSYQAGTCDLCGCEFKEYYKYSDTEWHVTEQESKGLQHRIKIEAYGYDIEINLCEQDGSGKWQGGSVTTNLHEPDHVLPKDPEPSDLAEAKEEQASIDAFNHMMDGIESFLLNLAMNNVDIKSSVFESALRSTMEACGNHA